MFSFLNPFISNISTLKMFVSLTLMCKSRLWLNSFMEDILHCHPCHLSHSSLHMLGGNRYAVTISPTQKKDHAPQEVLILAPLSSLLAFMVFFLALQRGLDEKTARHFWPFCVFRVGFGEIQDLPLDHPRSNYKIIEILSWTLRSEIWAP